MNNYLIIWPKSEDIKHINYHYTQFGESIDYLKKYFPNQILAVDCDVNSDTNNKNIISYIKDNNIEKVVMQINYENANNAFEMCDNIKDKFENISVLGYGSIPIRLPELFVNSKFDVIHREGDQEPCIKSFLKYYNQNEETELIREKIIGGSIIKNGELLKTKPGLYISPDNWGMSNWEDVPTDEYSKIKGKNRYILNISRGCPFGCPHCLIQLTEGRRERRRSIENLEKAIEKISEKYQHIKIWAANFTLDKQYVKEFCNIMLKYPDITWECATRIDLTKDEQMLKEMHEAGCRQISLGIESLKNRELIGTKDFKKEEISGAISRIQRNGISVKGCVMVGMPNQKKEDIVDTFKFLTDRNVNIRPNVYTPYQMIPKNVKLKELSQYNRKTYENNNVKGVSSKTLQKLCKNPYDYENILNQEQFDNTDKNVEIDNDER